MEFDNLADFEDSFADDDLRSCCDLDEFDKKVGRVVKSSTKKKAQTGQTVVKSKVDSIMSEIKMQQTASQVEEQKLSNLLSSKDENLKIKKIKELA